MQNQTYISDTVIGTLWLGLWVPVLGCLVLLGAYSPS